MCKKPPEPPSNDDILIDIAKKEDINLLLNKESMIPSDLNLISNIMFQMKKNNCNKLEDIKEVLDILSKNNIIKLSIIDIHNIILSIQENIIKNDNDIINK